MLGDPKSGFCADPVQYLILKRRLKTSHVQLNKNWAYSVVWIFFVFLNATASKFYLQNCAIQVYIM